MSKPLAVALCNDKRPCRGLDTFLREHRDHGGGIKAIVYTDLKTLHRKRPVTNTLYAIKSRASDNGVGMNYCPFCGRRINKRWSAKDGQRG